MDTLSAAARGEAARRAGARERVFDWHKAARLIAERRPTVASAGLGMDWEWTGGTIWEDGQPVTDSYTYLASNWATPEIDLDGELVECWVFADEAPGWGSGTKWPESALAIVAVPVSR